MKKIAELENSEVVDPKTGLEIAVSTTARIKLRELFRADFANIRNYELNNFAARKFAKSSSNVLHYFPLKKNQEGQAELWGEIRDGGSFLFVSAIRARTVDILTIQKNWREPTVRREKMASIKKNATNVKSHWPAIYQLLKFPPSGINLGSFPSQLPSMDKFKVDESAPGNAVGFVSTEDVDGDGNLDVIHISSSRLGKELDLLGLKDTDLSNARSLSKQQLEALLSVFVELISHEMGHLKDFNGGENPFPGGEGVAESAAQQALSQVHAEIDIEILKLSKSLEKSGLPIYANKVLEVIRKH